MTVTSSINKMHSEKSCFGFRYVLLLLTNFALYNFLHRKDINNRKYFLLITCSYIISSHNDIIALSRRQFSFFLHLFITALQISHSL